MPSSTLRMCTTLFLLLATGLTFSSEAALLASSSIEYCGRDSNVDPLPCEQKMVVTLTVDNGQAAGVEEIVFVRDAKTKTGSGEGYVEFEPVRLTTKKSRVQYRYPVFYERNFNAKPYEHQIVTTLVQGCNDLPTVQATCGLVMGSNGQPIPYSEGFCCSCGLCQLTGVCPPNSRSVQTCNLFAGTGMASCLRFDELWYSGYNIGSGSVWYRVEVTLSFGEDNVTNPNQATLSLASDTPLDSSPEFGAWARLVGDFASPVAPLDLTGKMLFVPSSPRTSERVKAGPREWILLDKHLVTVTGRECNKVGVSYEAFASQGDRCHMYKGACLADQLEDYREQDLAQESKGGKGKYMARFAGEFDFNSSQTTSPYITYWMKGSLSTVIVITVSADRLRYVLSVSPGVIVSTSVSQKVGASTMDGVLLVTVRNTGNVNSQYMISVGACTTGVHPMVAQPVSLAPLAEVARQFDLLVQDTAAEGEKQCSVNLQNARGDVVDTSIVKFKVTPVGWTNGTQGENSPGGSGGGVVGEGPGACERCAWYKLLCFLTTGCWWQPLMYVLSLLLVLLVVYVALKCCASRTATQKIYVERHEPTFIPQYGLHLPKMQPS